MNLHRPSWSTSFALLLSGCVGAAWGHPSDVSYLRVKVEREKVELRFTFNVLSLTRFFPGLDANQDHHVEKSELAASTTALNNYFNQHIELGINQRKSALGQAKPFEYVWPVSSGSERVSQVDYPVRYVDIRFVQSVKPLLADVSLNFNIWQQTGPLGTVEATYEQDDLRMQVPFSMSEPDYLYDTGYAVEQVFQKPVVKDVPSINKDSKPAAWLLLILEIIFIFVFASALIRSFFPNRKH